MLVSLTSYFFQCKYYFSFIQDRLVGKYLIGKEDFVSVTCGLVHNNKYENEEATLPALIR